MALSKIESDKQTLLKKLPDLVWEQVFRCNIIPTFSSLESCYEASDFFQHLIDTSGQLWITKDKQVPKPNDFWTLPIIIKLKPRITTFKLCIEEDFLLDENLIKRFLHSQKDLLETLHVSSAIIRPLRVCLGLPDMSRLRDLKIARTTIDDDLKDFHIRKSALPPLLETLTLSTNLWDDWSDLLLLPGLSFNVWKTVKHLRLHPSAFPCYIQHTIHKMSKICAFPNVISLEISAVYLNRICSLLPAPEKMRRLTLTMPLLLGHKHLFDMCITGYSKKMCAAILQNPNKHPDQIWKDIATDILEESSDDERQARTYTDIHRPPSGANRYPGVANFQGLEELRINSRTHCWGPTLVSCPDLLSMKSLKLLQFCGYKPEYIPDDMISKMRERFKVWFAERK